MVRVNTYVLHYLKAAPAEIFVFETLPDLEVSIDVELILDGEIVWNARKRSPRYFATVEHGRCTGLLEKFYANHHFLCSTVICDTQEVYTVTPNRRLTMQWVLHLKTTPDQIFVLQVLPDWMVLRDVELISCDKIARNNREIIKSKRFPSVRMSGQGDSVVPPFVGTDRCCVSWQVGTTRACKAAEVVRVLE